MGSQPYPRAGKSLHSPREVAKPARKNGAEGLAPGGRGIDWAIHRGGAVLIEGAINASFTDTRFVDTGGNALIFSRYAKNCSVVGSEFVRLGDSAVVAYGEVDPDTGDGVADEYPSGLKVVGNHMHEIGVWGKQTSCFFQGISGNNLFADNVCYNGPRALVNVNDGFLGMTRISGNVLFNPCRESHDHGAFNSWDRTPMRFCTHDSWGEPTWTPAVTQITENLILNAYGGSHNIDHDDGSEHYNSSANVVAFAQACKGNFGAHRRCDHNLVLLPGAKMYSPSAGGGGGNCASESDNGRSSTFADKHFDNNTCVLLGRGGKATAYSWRSCDVSTRNFNETCWGDGRNRFLVPAGIGVVVGCGSQQVPLASWQADFGRERGGSVAPLPSVGALMAMARRVLGLPEAEHSKRLE